MEWKRMTKEETIRLLEELINRRVLSDEWTDLIARAIELLKE